MQTHRWGLSVCRFIWWKVFRLPHRASLMRLRCKHNRAAAMLMIWFSPPHCFHAIARAKQTTFLLTIRFNLGFEVFMGWIICHAYAPKIIDMKQTKKRSDWNFPRLNWSAKILHIAGLAAQAKMRIPQRIVSTCDFHIERAVRESNQQVN